MGCAISKVHSRIIDASKGISSVNIEIVDIHNICSYFTDDDNPNPKCIFIFGGSGSNKGQFIWELLQQCQTAPDTSSGAAFHYHYIDVEKLILENIGKRIKKLTSEKTTLNTVNNNEDIRRKDSYVSDTSIKSSSNDSDLKTKMLLYANIVTNTWVLGLITKEIEKHSVDAKDRVFIVNLIPNRINLFRNCLFLKQAPSFVNFHFNYIAINLIKNNSKRKDLDQLTTNSGYDEVNNNFINYFRLINKLIEIKAEPNVTKIKIKITKNSKNSIKISTKEDLLGFIYTPKKDGMEIDLNQFNWSDCTTSSQNGLMFVIKNEIEIDENQVLVFDDNDFKVENVRKFTQIYSKLKDSQKCDPKTNPIQ